jgi:hypothetical protein
MVNKNKLGASNERRFGLLPKAVVLGLGGAAIALMGAGFANATTDIYVGGNGDTNAQGVVDTKIANGDYDFNANNIQVNYSASIAPLGPVPMGESVEEGALNTLAAVEANMGDPNITVEGFSLGAIVVDRTGNMLAEKYGSVPGNVTLVTDGNADSTLGLFQNPLIETFAPITDAFGIVTNINPEPGTINRTDVGDVWGNSANADIGGVINNALNMSGHRIPDEQEAHVSYVDENGVNQEVYGDVSNFVQPAPEAAPAPESVVKLADPNFFGEQPCFAPDGSQYFTPADAPC